MYHEHMMYRICHFRLWTSIVITTMHVYVCVWDIIRMYTCVYETETQALIEDVYVAIITSLAF